MSDKPRLHVHVVDFPVGLVEEASEGVSQREVHVHYLHNSVVRVPDQYLRAYTLSFQVPLGTKFFFFFFFGLSHAHNKVGLSLRAASHDV